LLEEILGLLRDESRPTAAKSRKGHKRFLWQCPLCSRVQFTTDKICDRCGTPIEALGTLDRVASTAKAIVSTTLQSGRFIDCQCDPHPDGSFVVTATDKAGKIFRISVPPDASFDSLHESIRDAFDEAIPEEHR